MVNALETTAPEEQKPVGDVTTADLQPNPAAWMQMNPTTQLLLTGKPSIHRPEAGLNPLVDAAAHLFSLMGKLKFMKSYPYLAKLQADLIEEIQNFQQNVRTSSYSADYLAEYVPISCYALCITLDDIIWSMPWGSQGKWDAYSLVTFLTKNLCRIRIF